MIRAKTGKRKRGKDVPFQSSILPEDRQEWEVLFGEAWQQHGIEVANTRTHIPSSWDKFLRNIDIKYSDYKAKEWETYFYGLGPGLLEGTSTSPIRVHSLPPSQTVLLPPPLEYVNIELAPFSANGKTTILPTPLDFSHLTQLTKLFLDGGEETSNLVSTPFFSRLTNAMGIKLIILQYCVVDSFYFPDFIRWFFGDWQVSDAEKGDRKGGRKIGERLEVRLFFGEWSEEEIVIARSMMQKYTRSERSGIWEPGKGEE
ncbi:hypothetical protein BT69DRAFT_1331986 [Atractiella rhizophila]|nr:hypothetical protein BT69DRAFT_1331986 [Atractiella rhizophila]